MVSGGVSTNHVGGAAQFLLCRNTTSRYFLPVKLLENSTIMSPRNNSTSKIQKNTAVFLRVGRRGRRPLQS